ncbi:MAG: hypothetical protein CEN90_90 [Parcubacteria group bacterium Licking1014_17]|nr:MAG: hypothetical protein CEN90_90 [Parcubacteria group bacterium Licking1014_17]
MVRTKSGTSVAKEFIPFTEGRELTAAGRGIIRLLTKQMGFDDWTFSCQMTCFSHVPQEDIVCLVRKVGRKNPTKLRSVLLQDKTRITDAGKELIQLLDGSHGYSLRTISQIFSGDIPRGKIQRIIYTHRNTIREVMKGDK